MKQLPGDIRNRLTKRSTFQNAISRSDVGEVMEAEDTDEDGRPGTPSYFASLLEEKTPEPEEDESSAQEGKGVQIDFEI